jgi:exodeoxyribonuclease VII large subunit
MWAFTSAGGFGKLARPIGGASPVTGPAANLREYTVSELSLALKRSIEDNFSYVRVRAEISGLTRAASGHVYFSLKDEKAVLDAVCWRDVAAKFPFQPEDGLEVVCEGKLSTYPARSRYQLIVMRIEPAGAGALMALLEARRKKLAAEGLFDAARKKPLPYLPSIIGVVTSPTGAVIRDILHRLADRFPRRVLLWPVQVQGKEAAGQVAAAIAGFNALKEGDAIPRPDLLIVARGGGSLEDLWAFNEEIVVRAAAASEIPLISAVGHETDTTLIDFASDMRAPTPSAAAELAVPVRAELVSRVAGLAARGDQARRRLFERARERLAGLARGIPAPKDILALGRQRLDELGARLPRSLTGRVQNLRVELGKAAHGLTPSIVTAGLRARARDLKTLTKRLPDVIEGVLKHQARRVKETTRLLESLSYQGVLNRGFALATAADGSLIPSARKIAPGQMFNVLFRDGEVSAKALSSKPAGGGKASPKTPKPSKKDQGTLL